MSGWQRQLRALQKIQLLSVLAQLVWSGQVVCASAAFTAALIESYAPIVYLYPGETFLPSSIEWALENEQVLVNSTLAKSSNGAAQPAVLNSSNLFFQDYSNAHISYLTTDQPLGCDTCVNPSFLRGQDPTHQEVPVYAITIPRDANTTSIYYWLFFPFNGGKEVGLCFNNLPAALLGGVVSKIASGLSKVFGGSSNPTVSVQGADAKLLGSSSSQGSANCQGYQELLGNHVGDWEHVEVKFDSRTSPPTPEYVRLSQHSGGQIFNWGDPALSLQNGTHPIVYAANGSHANYASIGQHQYSNMTILDNVIGLLDNTGQGIRWDTSEEIVMATWLSGYNYTGSQSWLGWPGNWGNQQSGCTSNPITALINKATQECPLDSGLQGPAYFMGPNVN